MLGVQVSYSSSIFSSSLQWALYLCTFCFYFLSKGKKTFLNVYLYLENLGLVSWFVLLVLPGFQSCSYVNSTAPELSLQDKYSKSCLASFPPHCFDPDISVLLKPGDLLLSSTIF